MARKDAYTIGYELGLAAGAASTRECGTDSAPPRGFRRTSDLRDYHNGFHYGFIASRYADRLAA